jgi:ribose 5-phosphate isomerase B
MKIAVTADHRGFDAKRKVLPLLKQWGHEIVDFGCEGPIPATDYPDLAFPAARAVGEGQCEVGIFLDGSGIGMSIAANKVHNVRAATVHDEMTARISREANHCNVLCLGADLLSDTEIRRIVRVFLETAFGDGRHARRVAKLRDFEKSAHAKQHA